MKNGNPLEVIGLTREMVAKLNYEGVSSIAKSIKREIARQYRPDLGLNKEEFQEINEAISFIIDNPDSFDSYKRKYLNTKIPYKRQKEKLEDEMEKLDKLIDRIINSFYLFVRQNKENTIFGESLLKIANFGVSGEPKLTEGEKEKLYEPYQRELQQIIEQERKLAKIKNEINSIQMHLTIAESETGKKRMKERIKKLKEELGKLKKETRRKREEIEQKVRKCIRRQQKQKKTLFEKNLYSLIKIHRRQMYEKNEKGYKRRGVVVGTINEEDFKKIQKSRSDIIRMKDVRTLQPRKRKFPTVSYEDTISEIEFKKFFLPSLSPYIKKNYYITTLKKDKKEATYKIEGRIIEIF